MTAFRTAEDKAQILTGSQNTRKSSNLTKISQWHPRFKPPEIKSVVCDEISSTLTKTEMDAQILQLFKIFFDKSVAEISVQSCLHFQANILFGAGATSVYRPRKSDLSSKIQINC